MAYQPQTTQTDGEQENWTNAQFLGNFGKLEQVLNWCSTSLNQNRFTWRHDSILNYMTEEMTKGKPEYITLYSDLPKYSINGGTIPADTLTTVQRPDIVIINRLEKNYSL